MAHSFIEFKRGRHVFICAHGLTGSSRKKEFAAPVLCLWADVDAGGLPTSGPPPTMVVKSSPGKFHLYFKLTRSIDPYEAEKLNKRLAPAIGADASGYDLSQLLRPPGTANYYYLDESGNPPEVYIFDAEYDLAYTPEYLDSVLPLLPQTTESSVPRSAKRRQPQEVSPPRVFNAPNPDIVRRLSGNVLRIFEGHSPIRKEGGEVDRSRSLFKMASALCEELVRQLPREDVLKILPDVLAERDATLGWEKYTDRPGHYESLAEMVMDRLKC